MDMRKIILASHHLMAEGLKDTLQYIGSSLDHIEAVCAYMDNIPVEQQLKNAIGKIDKNDEYIIFTDMLGGSVNQEAIKYLQYPNVYIITGMSLPIVLSIVLSLSSYDKVDETVIRSAIEDAKQQTVFVNDVVRNLEADDEDE